MAHFKTIGQQLKYYFSVAYKSKYLTNLGIAALLFKALFLCYVGRVTRQGDFLKFLSTNLFTKVAQKIGDFWPILK